jgi:hypothetical protein
MPKVPAPILRRAATAASRVAMRERRAPAPVRKFTAHVSLRESALEPSAEQGGRGRFFKGVTLIKSGLGNQRDKNYYPPETLRAAVESGLFEGLRAFVDHPDSISEEIQPERTVRDLAGVYEGARYNEERGTVEADLRVLKSHAWLADTIDELIDIGHSDKIGLSINGRGRTETSRRPLAEAGGEMTEVNEVKEFVVLRSTDIVTEAGAGGGFAQLLESAREVREMKTVTTVAKIAKALREAAASGDMKKVKKLSADLTAATKSKIAAGSKPVAEADEEKDALEEAADEVVAQADEAVSDDDDLEEADEDVEESEDDGDAADEDDEDLEESDDEDEDEDAVEAAPRRPVSAVDRFKAAAQQSQATREAAGIHGATGIHGSVKKSKGSFVKPAKFGKAGKSKLPQPAKPLKVVRAPGRTRESDARLQQLARENRELREKNSGLSHALRTRTASATARNLLRESGIPEETQPMLLKKLVKLPNAQAMREEIAFYESIAGGRESGRVEGAGASLRESAYGAGDGGDSVDSVLGSFGIPFRDAE